MSSHMSAPVYKKRNMKSQNITEFCSYDRNKLCDGMILDSSNIAVLSGGGLCSLPSENEIVLNTSSPTSLEGVYSYCEDCDAEYETQVTAEWVYKNICPKSLLNYEDWETIGSRILVKDIGKPAKTENGHRDVREVFFDGTYLYILYAAEYNIIDERRMGEMIGYDKGLVWQFTTLDIQFKGSVNAYRLVQLFMDVIDSKGNVKTALVDAHLHHLDKISDKKYQKSTLIFEDNKSPKYASEDYVPYLGEAYTVNYDNVYTELFPTLGDYSCDLAVVFSEHSVTSYNNVIDGGTEFSSSGKKKMLLPDRKLIEIGDSEITVFEEWCESMAPINRGVQLFDRLFGISGDTLYASAKGDCTDFESSNGEVSDSWKTKTADASGFTAIAAVDGKIVAFTNSSMITVFGDELPFTMSHFASCGCPSQNAVTVCGGKLYFVSENGVMCYSKNTVKSIDNGLPSDINYSTAQLTSVNGTIVLADSSNMSYLWVCMPLSNQWCKLFLAGAKKYLMGPYLLNFNSDGLKLYKLLEKDGEYSFRIALQNIGRRRINCVTVTARLGKSAMLILNDRRNEVVAVLYTDKEKVETKRCYLRGAYIDHGELNFRGTGDVSLLGLQIEYEDMRGASRTDKEI